MRVINIGKEAPVAPTAEYTPEYAETLDASPMTHKSYHEMSEMPVVETDCLAQLHTNLEMLSDLNNRLSFLMREVRYLLKA